MDNNVIKSGTEFLVVIGYMFIAIGVIGAIGLLVSFDWDAYEYLKDEMAGEFTTTMALSGACLLVNVAIGSFFIALDKIAYTLKKIQLGVKDDNVGREPKEPGKF